MRKFGKFGKLFAVKNDSVSRPPYTKKMIMNKKVENACALELSFSNINGHTNGTNLGLLWPRRLGVEQGRSHPHQCPQELIRVEGGMKREMVDTKNREGASTPRDSLFPPRHAKRAL